MANAIIDAYAHIGHPRFVTLAEYQGIMQRAGISRAVLCAFDSSPGLAEIHAGVSAEPGRFRGIGVPLGRDRAEMEAGIRAQLAAGFSGIRFSEADLKDRPWLLDKVAAAGCIAVIAGRVAEPTTAARLVACLEDNASARVVGCHFAGGGAPDGLASGPVAELLGHPRFHVVFSRQGGYAPQAIRAWAEAIVDRAGWRRVMWGSEVPVMFWRNETVAQAISWIDRLSPCAEDRAAFFSGNATRLYFDAPPRLAPLSLPFSEAERAAPVPATMWANALGIDQVVAGRLVAAWLAHGGDGTLGAFLESVLERSLGAEDLPGTRVPARDE